MADIVRFPHDDRERIADHTDTFLLDEGLEMLATYRAIRNPAVRASLRQLAKTLAVSSVTGSRT